MKAFPRLLTHLKEPESRAQERKVVLMGNRWNSYLIVGPVIYMCICDASYPRKLAFSYLDELSKEFQRSYEGKIEGASRPYAFMGFGK